MDIEEQIKNFKNMVNSYKLTYIIMTANNIGIFHCLGGKSKSLLQISKEVKIEKDRIEPILNALVCNHIISKNEEGYYLETYDAVLNQHSQYNQLGYIAFAQTLVEKYRNLESAVKDKNFAVNNFKELTQNNHVEFMRGMESNAIPQVEFLLSQYHFDNHKILDIGAGSGIYLISVAKKYKTVKGKMIDLPKIVGMQKERIKKEGISDRIEAESCDYNIKFPKEKYDDIFLFAIAHQEPEENLDKLLQNVYNHLNPDGRVFLTSFFLNENKTSPEFAVQFAVEMLINTNKGKVYTYNEIENLIKRNNFKEIQKIDKLPGPATLYVAKK